MLVAVLGFLAFLLVTAALMDLRVRRRGGRYRGVDAAAARDGRRRNEADLRSRANDPQYGNIRGPF